MDPYTHLPRDADDGDFLGFLPHKTVGAAVEAVSTTYKRPSRSQLEYISAVFNRVFFDELGVDSTQEAALFVVDLIQDLLVYPSRLFNFRTGLEPIKNVFNRSILILASSVLHPEIVPQETMLAALSALDAHVASSWGDVQRLVETSGVVMKSISAAFFFLQLGCMFMIAEQGGAESLLSACPHIFALINSLLETSMGGQPNTSLFSTVQTSVERLLSLNVLDLEGRGRVEALTEDSDRLTRAAFSVSQLSAAFVNVQQGVSRPRINSAVIPSCLQSFKLGAPPPLYLQEACDPRCRLDSSLVRNLLCSQASLLCALPFSRPPSETFLRLSASPNQTDVDWTEGALKSLAMVLYLAASPLGGPSFVSRARNLFFTESFKALLQSALPKALLQIGTEVYTERERALHSCVLDLLDDPVLRSKLQPTIRSAVLRALSSNSSSPSLPSVFWEFVHCCGLLSDPTISASFARSPHSSPSVFDQPRDLASVFRGQSPATIVICIAASFTGRGASFSLDSWKLLAHLRSLSSPGEGMEAVRAFVTHTGDLSREFSFLSKFLLSNTLMDNPLGTDLLFTAYDLLTSVQRTSHHVIRFLARYKRHLMRASMQGGGRTAKELREAKKGLSTVDSALRDLQTKVLPSLKQFKRALDVHLRLRDPRLVGVY